MSARNLTVKIEAEYRKKEDREVKSPRMPERALAAGPATSEATTSEVTLRKLCASRGVRALAWDGEDLYASIGYKLVRWRARANERRRKPDVRWEPVASFDPTWWRHLTSRSRLSSRLVRDGFHALTILGDAGDQFLDDQRPKKFNNKSERTLIAAVPGAIVTRTPGSDEFHLTHEIRRGTRPLHITATPGGTVYWGEYFDNRERAEVHIYASTDRGESWQIAYTFPARTIRHVHNIIYDRWADCLWILTGDEGHECKVLRASCDLRSVEIVLSGDQQARAVAAIPTPDALYLATDTPFEANHVLRLRRDGRVDDIASLASSSIFGCQVGKAIFFSTMVEPSAANAGREVHLVGSADPVSADKNNWQILARWTKDKWPMRHFQYGNALLPDGENLTNYLAATTVAVEQDDHVTTLWEVTEEVDTEKSGARNDRITHEVTEFERRPSRAHAKAVPGMTLVARWRYYCRILPAYLGSGRSQLTFWHETPELNPQATLDAQAHACQPNDPRPDARPLGPYYMSFRQKADYAGAYDANGIPMLDYRGAIGLQYNPIAIAQWGLANFNLFSETSDAARLQKTLKSADWLAANIEQDQHGCWVWNHHFNWEYRDTLKAPWYSGLAQGQGVSLLLRAHQQTGNVKYEQAAERAFVALTTPISQGGVLFEDGERNLWIEEYLVDPPTHILNGFIWALWGVLDFSRARADSAAKQIFNRGVATLLHNLPRFDTGYWSLYEQSGTRLKMLASPFYHRLHIVQLRVMANLTGDARFADFADRWEGYAHRRTNRTRAIAEKSIFKLLHY